MKTLNKILEGIMDIDDTEATVDKYMDIGWIESTFAKFINNGISIDQLWETMSMHYTTYTGTKKFPAIKNESLKVALNDGADIWIWELASTGRGKCNVIRFNGHATSTMKVYKWGGMYDYGDNNMAYFRKLLKSPKCEILLLPQGHAREMWHVLSRLNKH